VLQPKDLPSEGFIGWRQEGESITIFGPNTQFPLFADHLCFEATKYFTTQDCLQNNDKELDPSLTSSMQNKSKFLLRQTQSFVIIVFFLSR